METEYFAIRSEPDGRGDVIAIWIKEKESYHLSLGGQDGHENSAANANLLQKVTEAEFSVMDDIAEIPHIQSDRVYHFLGLLDWGVGRDPEPTYAIVYDLDYEEAIIPDHDLAVGYVPGQ